MPESTREYTHIVYSNGASYFFYSLADAKERIERLIREGNSPVFLFEAITRITPKPLETVETDLRAAPAPVVAAV